MFHIVWTKHLGKSFMVFLFISFSINQVERHNSYKPISCHYLSPFLLKISENEWFSDVFRGFRKRPVAWNGLTQQKNWARRIVLYDTKWTLNCCVRNDIQVALTSDAPIHKIINSMVNTAYVSFRYFIKVALSCLRKFLPN